MNTINDDHYLYGFTDDELVDVLLKPDEWGKINYNLAKSILTERGKEIDDAFLDSLKQQRLATLSVPEKSKKSLVIAGYVFAFLGGIPGIAIGYSLFAMKKTLPNKENVYTYSLNDRKHGQIIFVIGVIVFAVAFCYRLWG